MKLTKTYFTLTEEFCCLKNYLMGKLKNYRYYNYIFQLAGYPAILSTGIRPDIRQVISGIRPDIRQVISGIRPDSGYQKRPALLFLRIKSRYDYETSNSGSDKFRIHNTWLLLYFCTVPVCRWGRVQHGGGGAPLDQRQDWDWPQGGS
jgi:hypothetical protein